MIMENLDTVLSCLGTAKQTLNYMVFLEHSLHSKEKRCYENKGGEIIKLIPIKCGLNFFFYNTICNMIQYELLLQQCDLCKI